MLYEPHPYQLHATEKILSQPAVGLFLEMGLGKTVSTLTAVHELIYDRFETSKVLVIAPLRVAQDTWSREIEKWDHLQGLTLSKVLGSEKLRLAGLAVQADIYVINRENVEWLVLHYGKDWPFDTVVIDELSSFKNRASKRFKALRKVRGGIKRMIGLTGTPAPNGLLDLWAQVYLLDQGNALGRSFTTYRDLFFEPDKRSRALVYTFKAKDTAETDIYQRLEGLCVSMKAADWLDMPERIDIKVDVALPAKVLSAYEDFEREFVLQIPHEEDVEASTAAVLAGKLLQIAGGAIYTENKDVVPVHDEKLDALEDLIEQANGRPVLVYYGYQHELERLKARFPQAEKIGDSDHIAKWNRGEVPVMLAHPASAGHGLNLQDGGDIIVWFGLNWSLELYQQANARLHRQGQQNAVRIYHLVANNTIDETVMQVLKSKEAKQEHLLQAMKARINEIRREHDGN